MKTTRLIVRGRVQGVGFRAHVREAAALHGVRGWVRNQPDGTVEIAVQGPSTDFVEAVRRGPAWSRVDAVETDETDEAPYRGFEVRF